MLGLKILAFLEELRILTIVLSNGFSGAFKDATNCSWCWWPCLFAYARFYRVLNLYYATRLIVTCTLKLDKLAFHDSTKVAILIYVDAHTLYESISPCLFLFKVAGSTWSAIFEAVPSCP